MKIDYILNENGSEEDVQMWYTECVFGGAKSLVRFM